MEAICHSKRLIVKLGDEVSEEVDTTSIVKRYTKPVADEPGKWDCPNTVRSLVCPELRVVT